MLSYNNNCFSLTAPTAVALGCFDGVHIGHRAVIREAVAIAKEQGINSAVWCFDSPPKNFFIKNSAPLLTTPEEKIALISELLVDVTVCVPFDNDIGNYAEMLCDFFVFYTFFLTKLFERFPKGLFIKYAKKGAF